MDVSARFIISQKIVKKEDRYHFHLKIVKKQSADSNIYNIIKQL